jgi:predicted DNA-binding transcriptional regulator YafY
MDRDERLLVIDQLLRSRRLVRFEDMRQKLGVSAATVKRDLEFLRNRLNSPLQWDRETGGYQYREQEEAGSQFALPGQWFGAAELRALLVARQLLTGLTDGGLLAPHLPALLAHLKALLGAAQDPQDEMSRRVRLIPLAARQPDEPVFAVLGAALLHRKRLFLRHESLASGAVTEREVSPQRLVLYRDNWYLDAWCHLRQELRTFAVDGVRRAEMLDSRARNVSERTLDAVLGAGYGLFAGRRVTWATLRFSPRLARRVSREQWHPRQRGRFTRDGGWLLTLPYSDDRELVMDILRHGAEVEVLKPEGLRERLREEARRLLERYS